MPKQIGRNLTGGAFTINPLAPGTMYGGGDIYGNRNRNLDISVKKIFRMGRQRLTAGLDVYNLWNGDTTLNYNTAYVQNAAGNGSAANNAWLTSLAYMNPRGFRIAGEFNL